MANSGSKYQVFLNFCGIDTRRGFTNTLYHALVDAGIRVFIDNEELPPGETFSRNLLQAIEDSKLYITIFSPNYASKHWCLRELVKMVDSISNPEEDGNNKVILPIFYNVKPDDVKLKTDLYGKAILELEQKMEDRNKKFSTEEVEKWRRALKKIDAIQGWELEKYQGDGDLSKSVVEEIVNRLQTRQRKVTGDLVGMDDQIAAINNLLDINFDGVRLIGIYGMGGIGKTTLAKKIFNQLLPHFGKNCCFLDDIKEMANTQDLVKLQRQLLSHMSNSRAVCNIANNDNGINRIEETLRKKKVLIVLDDVDAGKQIEELIGTSLSPGTRILVTTRDKGVLKIRGFNYEIVPYEMKGLSDKDALQLFSRHAFEDNSPPPKYYTLSKDIVSRAGGLPLALQTIGSSLFGQDKKKIWEEMLEELRKTPHDDVSGKLKISYDTLKPGQQQIFLDIACFFIGSNKIDPIYMWKDCGFRPNYAIDVLINRCMIKVLDNDTFWMHDQFRDLGRAIADQERSRLRATDDIIRQLRSKEINKSVQALHLGSRRQRRMTVTSEQIKRFPHLRLLRLRNITCQGDFTGCLSELRWIRLRYQYEYRKRDPQFMAINLHLENVVVMHIGGNEWTESAVRNLIEGARKLKALTLQNAHSLRKTPTFSENSVLEKLTILECKLLKEIDCSIGKLRQLTDLSVESCKALEKLPHQIGKLKNLQNLSLIKCCSLRELPTSVLELKLLTKLDVSHMRITKLPDSIGRLQSLSSLNVSFTKIVKLPGTTSQLSQLHTLDLYDCNEIQKLPKLPRSLTTVWLRSNSLETIPDLSYLTNLVELLLSDASEGCGKSNIIQPCDLPWIGRLSKLRKLELCLIKVHATSAEWDSLSLLKKLTLYGLDLQTLKQLPSSLTVLELFNTQVKQAKLDGLPQLEKLTIRRCELITRISITSSLKKLTEVDVDSCNKLVEVQFLGVLISLQRSHIEKCKSLERLVCLSEEPGFNELQAPEFTDGWRRVSLVSSSLKMLQKLHLSRCLELQQIQFVSALEALRQFSVQECISLKKLGGLSNLKNLKFLDIEWCENLQVVEGINELEFLHSLRVDQCRSMERIFDASSSKIPDECCIIVRDCGEFPSTTYSLNVSDRRSCGEKILNGVTRASVNIELISSLREGSKLAQSIRDSLARDCGKNPDAYSPNVSDWKSYREKILNGVRRASELEERISSLLEVFEKVLCILSETDPGQDQDHQDGGGHEKSEKKIKSGQKQKGDRSVKKVIKKVVVSKKFVKEASN